MLVELLRMAGGEGAELLRRWSAALLAAPSAERRAIVEAVEHRIIEMYCEGSMPASQNEARLLHVEGEPVQREGFSEVVVRSFAATPAPVAPAKTRTTKKHA